MKNILYTLLLSLIFIASSCEMFQRPENKQKKTVSKKGEYIVNENGDSVKVSYSSNGKIKSSITIKNNRRNGIAYLYYPNGNVQFEIMYKDGFKHGPVKYYYESGRIYRETNYVKGQIDGIQRKYYENGKLQAEIPYDMGQVKMGTKEYTSSGKLITKYPKIKVVPIDKMAMENTYYLKIYLEPKRSKVRYYINRNIGGITGITDLEDRTRGGIAKYAIRVYPGQSIMEKVDIRAEFKTKKGNPKVIRRIYNLAVENRSY